MKWIEPYSYQYRSDNPQETFSESENSAIKELEERLGGKLVSKREVRRSDTGASGFVYCEALVEIDLNAKPTTC